MTREDWKEKWDRRVKRFQLIGNTIIGLIGFLTAYIAWCR